ncbi:V-type proton ATPase 116 kDa subunit a [Drosophila guanche]|uniref:V-type proton ATPase subunit a n=1 Tax=Drosophila guanche TaxID=7266 RepID=A0A3B0KN44_DROGU|nr:V-type proton ATPase 116 kDa subunit a [Drosophila guanche]SPP87999.1 blast:V-type proton ATPase 116 kDa subunit a isoform 1 [Drosophila guanche]
MSKWWSFGSKQETDSIFRSEVMSLVQMFLQPEAAYDTLAELGEVGCAQFRDMNKGVNAQQRKFIGEVRRCDELERKIRYVTAELEKDGHKVLDLMDDFPPAPKPRDIIELETHLEKTETEIMELAANNINLGTSYLELTEMIQVLERTDQFFSNQESHNFDLNKRGTHRDPEQTNGHLGFVAGVINREREYAFERMLWRISRGNVFVRRAEVDVPLTDPRTGSVLHKSVFVVFFQGDQLQARIRKVCTGFHAHMYPCPSSHSERMDMVKSVRTRLDDLKAIISQTEDHRNCVLNAVGKQLPKWTAMVKKMKAIYHTLNLFNVDLGSKCLIGEAWVPKRELELVETALAAGSATVGSTIPSFINVLDTKKEPPTYYRLNKFTRGFQNLIDAYGISSYREVNPGLYTCITFPFLFAVMFGDMGHGTILFLLGLWMVLDERRLTKKRGGEIWNIFFAGRYIILLMGLFAMYTGFHYNDIFSKSINLFGSHWVNVYNRTTVLTNPTLQLNPSVATRGVYPMGLDPVWQSASNKIIFLNTYKMKLSIIFGVLHMTFGVCLSVENFVFFKKYAYIFLQFVPQVLFLLLMFGYMCFMMFYKWIKYSPTTTVLADSPGCAPSVLIMFIDMVLFKTETASPGCDVNMFPIQREIEMIFFVVAILCIPWILIGKPLYIKWHRRNMPAQPVVEVDEVVEKIEVTGKEVIITEVAEAHESGGHSEEDDEPMSEIWIHQAIHTIEYILSTISHTASYLRLWALSLAHAQLSEVLWTMVLSMGLQMEGYTGAIGLFFIFAVWEFFTIAIMVMMEGLSAFLHTLRLHWVEFMSKFYAGAGYAFQPFSFKELLTVVDED